MLWGLVSSWLSKDAKWGPWNLFLLQQSKNKTAISHKERKGWTKKFFSTFKSISNLKQEVIQDILWTTKMKQKCSTIVQKQRKYSWKILHRCSCSLHNDDACLFLPWFLKPTVKTKNLVLVGCNVDRCDLLNLFLFLLLFFLVGFSGTSSMCGYLILPNCFSFLQFLNVFTYVSSHGTSNLYPCQSTRVS